MSRQRNNSSQRHSRKKERKRRMLLKKLSLLPCLNLSRKSSSLKMVKVSQTCSINQFAAIDYKATLCPYFKAGVCEKGKKCKYSHDMTIE